MAYARLDTGFRRYDAKESQDLFNELLRHHTGRLLKKGSECFDKPVPSRSRRAQHARIFLNHFSFLSARPEPVEGLRMSFSAAC
jgi:hypothetical protein